MPVERKQQVFKAPSAPLSRRCEDEYPHHAHISISDIANPLYHYGNHYGAHPRLATEHTSYPTHILAASSRFSAYLYIIVGNCSYNTVNHSPSVSPI